MTTNPVNNDQTVSLGDWIVTMILSGIPIVGLIMILVWAFGEGAKPSKKNYARAVIIMAIIGIIIGILLSILFSAIFASLYSSMADSMSSYSY